MSSSRVQWRRFNFFDKDSIEENIEKVLGTQPTCACAGIYLTILLLIFIYLCIYLILTNIYV
jgi:hypothetical protein